MKQAKLAYSLLGQAFEKQTKTIADTAEKQTKAIEGKFKIQLPNTQQNSIAGLFSKHFLLEENVSESNKIKGIEQKLNRGDLIYKTGKNR